jgi:hypothetical protein
MSRRPLLTIFSLLLFLSVTAQQNTRTVHEKCGTMIRLQQRLQEDALFRARFEQKKIEFNKMVSDRSFNKSGRLGGTVYIPIVFHIVLPNPNVVSDAQIQAQLDTLNKDFFGSNGDSVKIPSYFKPLFGKSNIQFVLAQRTPDGDATNGIDRVVTSKTSFSITDDGIKHGYAGGVDSWNTDKYFNVWVGVLADNLLGYATIPGDNSFPAADQGVAMEYRSLPGGSFTAYNGGKTLTHETGHYFNLYHIWGDDSGSCTGTDNVGDTPNQADATSGCPSGIKTDACTTGGNGIMYQNYMDYTDDPCLVMFTTEQVDRMETAVSFYRPSLLSSNGGQPVVLNNYDAQLRSVNQPVQRLCSPTFTPQVTIRNRGSQNLTTLQISTKIDNGPVTTYPWTGALTTYNTITISLNNLTAIPGNHTLTVYVSNPDNNVDQDQSNDTLQINFQYFTPVIFTSAFASSPLTELTESFESNVFPPQGWDIMNPDNALTWKRVTGFGKTGNASVMMDNYNYDHIGESDDLRMRTIKIPAGIDSAFLSFQVAAAAYSDLTTQNNNWDTLQVLVSTDCGQTYSSLYKKWGKTLVTTNTAITSEFFPSSSEWRKDSIDLAGFIGNNELLIAFRNTTGFENNIYLDDINVRTVTINPNLKAQGFLVTPNPTTGVIAVQFYPQPANLRGIQIFNDMGRKIAEVNIGNNQPNNSYNFDLSRYQKGMYIVKAIFTDRVLTKKIIRL